MGIRSQVSRNLLANTDATRDWRIYADFTQRLIGIARKPLRSSLSQRRRDQSTARKRGSCHR
jgi:hypothetical protein